MELFKLTKVMDPHQHMPEDIKDAFFEAHKDYVHGNNSYVTHSVGEYVGSLKEGDENDPYYNSSMSTFDKWMMENFELNESIMILYWW
jgi:hypothetical protein